jgi:hypothetical protein
MTRKNIPAKSDTHYWTPLLPGFVSRIPTAVTVAFLVAVFVNYALGFNKQVAKNNSAASKTLVATERVDHLDRLAREPMVVELSDGTLFVSGYDGDADKSPNLWRSHDRGATWESVNVGGKADAAIGNSDVDLAVSRDDTLYFVVMSFDRKAGEGTRITVGVTKNAGATWSWKILSENRFDDRPWVAVAPNGTAHVIWNDGNGIRHAVSQDDGASWNVQPRINDQGGSSHLSIGSHGEVAVRVVPLSASGNKFTEGVDLIAVSFDGGKTWQKHAAPGQRDWSPDFSKGTPRWVEPVAWDESGALYYLWGTTKGLWLARSFDHGETWTNWHIVERDEVSYYPYLIARGRGELAATWSSGQNETSKCMWLESMLARVKPRLESSNRNHFKLTLGQRYRRNIRQIRCIELRQASTYQSHFYAREAWALSLRFRIGPRSDSGLHGGNSSPAEVVRMS